MAIEANVECDRCENDADVALCDDCSEGSSVADIREALDKRRYSPTPPTREQVEFVELLIDDLESR